MLALAGTGLMRRREENVVIVGVVLCLLAIAALIAQLELVGGILFAAFFLWMIVGGWLIRRSDPYGRSGQRGLDVWQ
jgi:hypothetical protein